MKNKYKDVRIDFSDITPKIQIKKVKHSKNYKKAFLKPGIKTESGFSRNTSADD